MKSHYLSLARQTQAPLEFNWHVSYLSYFALAFIDKPHHQSYMDPVLFQNVSSTEIKIEIACLFEGKCLTWVRGTGSALQWQLVFMCFISPSWGESCLFSPEPNMERSAASLQWARLLVIDKARAYMTNPNFKPTSLTLLPPGTPHQ